MNAEFIAVLEHLEREKGVSRKVLLEAVQSALASAARKVVTDKESQIEVRIDEVTGDITVLSNGSRVESGEFGRIAAQSAKQVIIQKIREAEREAIYNEFNTKAHSILSGIVYRYDKGAIILDLGKTEALLLKREQSPRDSFRQGDRARVYVLEVNKSSKGPQVVVSRSHPGLVKKLFEMEVPEVLEGIVEIKAVSRDAGDRSKIAVWSKDEKVDCVGSCVGMRGLRVKNIVRELQGEKIDIVRWSDDITEYVKGALSPAQCAQVTLVSRDDKKVNVIVDEDQLSLAIGRNGQNVRLAAKLTGWNIDIRSKKDIAKEKLGSVPAGQGADIAHPGVDHIDGVGKKVQSMLDAAGITQVSQIAAMTEEDLRKIEGIGDKKAKKILASAKALLSEAKEAEGVAEKAASNADQVSANRSPDEVPSQSKVGDEIQDDRLEKAKQELAKQGLGGTSDSETEANKESNDTENKESGAEDNKD